MDSQNVFCKQKVWPLSWPQSWLTCHFNTLYRCALILTLPHLTSLGLCVFFWCAGAHVVHSWPVVPHLLSATPAWCLCDGRLMPSTIRSPGWETMRDTWMYLKFWSDPVTCLLVFPFLKGKYFKRWIFFILFYYFFHLVLTKTSVLVEMEIEQRGNFFARNLVWRQQLWLLCSTSHMLITVMQVKVMIDIRQGPDSI